MPRLRTRCIRVAQCDTRFDPPRAPGSEGRCDKCLALAGDNKPVSVGPKPSANTPISPVKVKRASVLSEPMPTAPIWPQDD